MRYTITVSDELGRILDRRCQELDSQGKRRKSVDLIVEAAEYLYAEKHYYRLFEVSYPNNKLKFSVPNRVLELDVSHYCVHLDTHNPKRMDCVIEIISDLPQGPFGHLHLDQICLELPCDILKRDGKIGRFDMYITEEPDILKLCNAGIHLANEPPEKLPVEYFLSQQKRGNIQEYENITISSSLFGVDVSCSFKCQKIHRMNTTWVAHFVWKA